jgi:endoglucanase
MKRHRRVWSAMFAGGVVVAVALAQPAAAHASQDRSSVSVAMTTKTAEVPAQVRVNQVGYATNGAKVAYAMLPRKVARVTFEVVTPYGVAYRGTSADDTGAWNANYPAVYKLSFSGLRLPGQYRVKLLSPATAVSPGFTVGDGTQLYQQLVGNAVRYFTSERDGPDVVSSVLNRQPANLTDAKASVYADPRYDDNDNLLGTLKKTGGPVDVSGGWFDAGGGYEKFGYTASYADGLMLLAARDNPGSRIPARARTTSSTGRCSRPRRPARRSAPTWPAATPPTSPSARSRPPGPTRPRPGTC